MKLTSILLIASGIVFFYLDSALAGQVGELNTFTANTPAVAAQVNDNFNDVTIAVDDNYNRTTTNAANIEGKQNRVTGSCPSGQSIRSINEDGSVVCEFDDNSGGDIDGAIATHASDADAHHTRYTNAEAIEANQPTIDAINTEIDSLNAFTSIAHAFIYYDGTITSGTSNVTSCTWNADYSRYEITISGEDYYFSDYVTVVTPTSNEFPLFANISSVGGQLLVHLYDVYEVPFQGNFQFVTFRP